MIKYQPASFALSVLLLIGLQELSGQNPPTVYKTADGGVRETLESISIPPVAKAPFSLTLETEWTRPLSGGGSYTLVNRRHIMRDSAGRIYQERWFLVPKDGKIESKMQWIQISDPEKHTYYNCTVATKVCTERPYLGLTNAVYQPQIGTSRQLPDGSGFQKHDDLGTSSVAGVTTIGYRDATTINAGAFGNDQPMTTTREFWFAPSLGLNLLSILDSPKAGKQTFTVTELTTSEPDPQFFAIPEGYKVLERDKIPWLR